MTRLSTVLCLLAVGAHAFGPHKIMCKDGTEPVNQVNDFPGKISCGCGEPSSLEVPAPECVPCQEDSTEFFWYSVNGVCTCLERDDFASSGGCLAVGTCVPDPTCQQ